ncbi:hypothetical protein KL867_02940, partial [Ruegeria litorea]
RGGNTWCEIGKGKKNWGKKGGGRGGRRKRERVKRKRGKGEEKQGGEEETRELPSTISLHHERMAAMPAASRRL